MPRFTPSRASLTMKMVAPTLLPVLAVIGGGLFTTALLNRLQSAGEQQSRSMQFTVELERIAVSAKGSRTTSAGSC